MGKTRIMQTLCLLALACGMLAGCKKDGGEKVSIRFSASSNAVSTRTAYSGAGQTSASGSLVKERIDWVVDDAITIWSDKAVNMTTGNTWGDYKILTVTPDETRSKATLQPVDVNSLQWGEEGTYKFYARYPADGTKINGTSMTATIPATQQMLQDSETGDWAPDMQYAFMFASATATNTKDPVTLEFVPEFTAFQFEIGAGGNGEAKISSFTLESSSTPLTGAFTVACATGVATSTSTTKTLAMDLSNRSDAGVLTITGGSDPVTLTLFALPADIANLTLTVVGTPFGTRTLKLADKDGNMLSFPGGKKYWIKGLDLPELLEATGEDINWDVEARGENIYWD